MYMERHIEVDGDHHSVMAAALLREVCGVDTTKWDAVRDTAISALRARMELWDAALDAIQKPNTNANGKGARQ
jgi:hypothetical protein